jgi:hypothetical protein
VSVVYAGNADIEMEDSVLAMGSDVDSDGSSDADSDESSDADSDSDSCACSDME